LGGSETIFIPHYWAPVTLFGWVPGVESFLFTFISGGLTSTLYKVLGRWAMRSEAHAGNLALTLLVLLLIIGPMLLGAAWPRSIFAVQLIYVEAVTMSLGAGLIAWSRKDLGAEIVGGGGLFVLLHLGGLLLLEEVLFPGWSARTWNLHTLSGHRVGRIPVEEPLWAFTFGAVWAPLYEVLTGSRLTRSTSKGHE
jgi:hypothetical protein